MGGDQFQNIMFVLGMDAEMVATALQESYNNVIRRLPQYSILHNKEWYHNQ
jgi:hypothetical protein